MLIWAPVLVVSFGCEQTTSVASPHPSLRATFPAGEGKIIISFITPEQSYC